VCPIVPVSEDFIHSFLSEEQLADSRWALQIQPVVCSGKHSVLGSTALLKGILSQNPPWGHSACRFCSVLGCLFFQKTQIFAGWKLFPFELTLFELLTKNKALVLGILFLIYCFWWTEFVCVIFISTFDLQAASSKIPCVCRVEKWLDKCDDTDVKSCLAKEEIPSHHRHFCTYHLS